PLVLPAAHARAARRDRGGAAGRPCGRIREALSGKRGAGLIAFSSPAKLNRCEVPRTSQPRPGGAWRPAQWGPDSLSVLLDPGFRREQSSLNLAPKPLAEKTRHRP